MMRDQTKYEIDSKLQKLEDPAKINATSLQFYALLSLAFLIFPTLLYSISINTPLITIRLAFFSFLYFTSFRNSYMHKLHKFILVYLLATNFISFLITIIINQNTPNLIDFTNKEIFSSFLIFTFLSIRFNYKYTFLIKVIIGFSFKVIIFNLLVGNSLLISF